MIPAILGRKVGMTAVYDADGVRRSVTIVEAGPCTVLQIKSADGKDGYHAVQLGFKDRKPHRSTLPEIGHVRKAKAAPKQYVREIRLADATDKQVGDTVTVELFTAGEVKWVDVIGTTKGKGFQGGMRRYGFGGQPASHGTERKHRSPGSIASFATNRGFSGRPKKGKRMAGHMGDVRRTAQCLRLMGVDPESNCLWVEGSIPGPKNGLVIVQKAKMKS